MQPTEKVECGIYCCEFKIASFMVAVGIKFYFSLAVKKTARAFCGVSSMSWPK